MLHRTRAWVQSVFIITVFLILSVAITAAQEDVVWPTSGWQTSTPEEQGMDSVALAELIENMPKLGQVDSLMVIRNGYMVAEVYWLPFRSGLKREIQSASKSVISALVGIALDKGYIKSIDQKVLEFFPEIEVKNFDDNKRAMTIRNLLTMTSGFDCEISLGTDPLFPLMTEPNAIQFGLNWVMADKPGTTWRYCQINAYLLSAILNRTTGMKTMDFATQYLFAPLGITDVDWNVSAEGLVLGYVGLQLTTRDMAKIGYLYLNNGRWGDAQIVPAGWVRESTQNYAPQNPWDIRDVGYGYLWWTYHTLFGDFFEAQGAYFQHIRVSPATNLVVADTGVDMNVHIQNINYPRVMIEVLKAVKSDETLPPNPEGVARLETAARAAANPEAKPVVALPPLAAEISGKTYRLASPDLRLADLDMMRLTQEDWQMATLGLDFGQDAATLRLQTVSGTDLSVAVGLDGICRETTGYMGTLAAEGRWENETQFVLYLHRLEQGPVLKYVLNFSDGALTGTAESARPGDAFAAPPSELRGDLMQ